MGFIWLYFYERLFIQSILYHHNVILIIYYPILYSLIRWNLKKLWWCPFIFQNTQMFWKMIKKCFCLKRALRCCSQIVFNMYRKSIPAYRMMVSPRKQYHAPLHTITLDTVRQRMTQTKTSRKLRFVQHKQSLSICTRNWCVYVHMKSWLWTLWSHVQTPSLFKWPLTSF